MNFMDLYSRPLASITSDFMFIAYVEPYLFISMILTRPWCPDEPTADLVSTAPASLDSREGLCWLQYVSVYFG